MKTTSVILNPQFNGPPNHGNGGYVSGFLASHLSGPVEVTINKLVPLGKTLFLKKGPGVAGLYDQNTLLAEAKPSSLKLSPPEKIPFETAQAWSKNYQGISRKVQDGCFVCDYYRKEGDGLGVFPGRLEKKGPVAAPWRPHPNFCNEKGMVDPVFIWSALDCPGYWSTANPEERALLGKITGVVIPGISTNEKCVIMAWPIRNFGFAFEAGTAIYNEAGRLKGLSRQIWLRIKKP